MQAGVVGRQAERAEIARFLEREISGPRALVLRGEPGVGKTTLLEAAVAAAQSRGLRVLRARPTVSEQELPHAALADLLDGVADEFGDRLAEPQRAALGAAMRSGVGDAEVEAHALARGVLELLRVAGADGDLLVVIDDVQWLDRPTVAGLAFALRRLGRVPLRVLAARRASAGERLQLPLGLDEWDDVAAMTIGGLSVTELGAVIRQRLGGRLSRPRLEAVARASGGNPLFALELAADRGAADAPAVTLSLALAGRLRRVDDDVRWALAAAAAAIQPSRRLLLRARVARGAVDAALATGIVIEEGQRLVFAHPLLATAAYESLAPRERRALHERLAAASRGAIERGHHESLAVSTPDETAAHVLEQAAGEAARLGDHAGAARFLERAAELSTERETGRRQVLAAEALATAGDIEAAGRLAGRLVDRLPAGPLRARVRMTHAFCRVGATMSYEQELSELALALKESAEDPRTAATVHLAMSRTESGVCRLPEAIEHARRAEALAERCGASDIALGARAERGFAECMAGGGVTATAVRAFEDWDGELAWSDVYSPRMALACAHMHATEFAEAERLFNHEVEAAEERGLEETEVVARAHIVECQLRTGRWPEALRNARLALEHAEQATPDQVSTGASCWVAALEGLLGDHEAARARAAGALANAAAAGDFWWIIHHRAVIGLLALAEEDPGAAVAALEPAWALMRERRLGDLSIFPVAQVLGEALAAVGRTGDAAAIAHALRQCPVGTGRWSRAMSHRIDALVHSANGDHARARLTMSASLEAHAELSEPFEQARALLIAGRIERRARGWGAARASCQTAAERFEALGAVRWAANARNELQRLPGRRPAARGVLTPREREVVDLVVEGLANKQIAARLFVTPHTVETHLSRAYEKLGVRSRTQLARRLTAPIDSSSS